MTVSRSLWLAAAVAGALSLGGCGEQKPPAPPPEPPAPTPAASSECPSFTVASEVGKEGAGTVAFTISPAPPGTVVWSTTAGSISGDGGTVVVRDVPAGTLVTASAELGGLPPACRQQSFVSGTAQIP
jgi:hypothetical protein